MAQRKDLKLFQNRDTGQLPGQVIYNVYKLASNAWSWSPRRDANLQTARNSLKLIWLA